MRSWSPAKTRKITRIATPASTRILGLLTEFNWIKNEAEEITVPALPDPHPCAILSTMFGDLVSPESQAAAAKATSSPAPYAR